MGAEDCPGTFCGVYTTTISGSGRLPTSAKCRVATEGRKKTGHVSGYTNASLCVAAIYCFISSCEVRHGIPVSFKKIKNRDKELQEYIDTIDENDYVIIESINNAFYRADQIEKQWAACIIVNNHTFKIIKDSWNKTDKRDSARLTRALWMSILRDEFKLSVVYKPAIEI